MAIVGSGIAFSVFESKVRPPDGAEASATLPSTAPTDLPPTPPPTAIPGLAILDQPAPVVPVPMNAGWLRWLDPVNGTFSGAAEPPGPGDPALTFVDARGRAMQICVQETSDLPERSVQVLVCPYDEHGNAAGLYGLATYLLPVTVVTDGSGAEHSAVQMDATISRDGTWLWLVSAVRTPTEWTVDLRRVDLTTRLVVGTRVLRRIPVGTAGIDAPSADGWLVDDRAVIEPVVRVSPGGSRASVTLTAIRTSPRGSLLQQERLVLDAGLTPASPVTEASPVGAASDLACESRRAAWASERHYLSLCQHLEPDGSVQPFVRIENPDDITRDVAIGPTESPLTGTADDSSWLLDAQRGVLYRWAQGGPTLSTLDVSTRDGSTTVFDPEGVIDFGGIEIPAGGFGDGGQIPWTQLATAGGAGAGLELAGRSDGRYVYAAARFPLPGQVGPAPDFQPRSVVWVIDTARNAVVERWFALGPIDQIALAPGGGSLLELATPPQATGDGLASDWIAPLWFLDPVTSNPLEVIGQLRGPGNSPPALLSPFVGTLAGF